MKDIRVELTDETEAGLQKQVDLMDSTDAKEATRIEREIKSNFLRGKKHF